MCPHMRAHWRHMVTTIKLVLRSAHPSPQPNRKSISSAMFERLVVKRFALCYRTVVLSVLFSLSETLVYCGQTVGWSKMKLGMQVGLGPAHIV